MSHSHHSKATVVLGHRVNKYKGQEFGQFSGKLKIGKKEYLLSISCDGSDSEPKLYQSDKDGTNLMFLNVIELDPNYSKKRKNEL